MTGKDDEPRGQDTENQTGSDAESADQGAPRPRHPFIARLRRYFFAGILVTAPAGITLYLAWIAITFVDARVTPFLPAVYNPSTYLPFSIPGVGVVVVIVGLTLIGALTAGLFGRFLLRFSERVLNRMPVVRNVYGAMKQIFETVFAERSTAFRDVVLVEYPRQGIWVIGFITGMTEGEIQHLTADKLVNVFIPTTPNPTSGFLLFVPRQDLVTLEMTVEEGIKMVVSGGIVTPPDRRPMAVQRIPRISASASE